MTDVGWAAGYAPDDRIDLGGGVQIVYEPWGEIGKAGVAVFHTNPTTGAGCVGAIMFDLPGVRETFPDKDAWQVESWDPLTVSPSLLCGACGNHGWIRSGAWVSA